MFSNLLENSLPFPPNLKMWAANSFSLEEFKICCLGKGYMQNINAHCILGYKRKMSEIIQLIIYENNERLGSDF